MVRLIGLDPGLQRTGWGIISVTGNHLRHIAHGTVTSHPDAPLAERLVQLFMGIEAVLQQWQPHEAAVEETFVNKNPASTLKLGLARGMALLAPARLGLKVAEYPANLIKKSVVGSGHADKTQIQMMVTTLLPGIAGLEGGKIGTDAADALAVAICHAHHAATRRLLGGVMAGAAR
jgi:crossover junction endodeoxyribonuclease RuvC